MLSSPMGDGQVSIPEEMLIVTKTEDMGIIFEYFRHSVDPLPVYLSAKFGFLIFEAELRLEMHLRLRRLAFMLSRGVLDGSHSRSWLDSRDRHGQVLPGDRFMEDGEAPYKSQYPVTT